MFGRRKNSSGSGSIDIVDRARHRAKVSLSRSAEETGADFGTEQEGRDSLDWRTIYQVLDRVSHSLDEALLAHGKQNFAPTHMSVFLNEALDELGIKLTSRGRSALLGRVLKELCGPGSRVAALSEGGFKNGKQQEEQKRGAQAIRQDAQPAAAEEEGFASLSLLVEEGRLSPAMSRFLELAVLSRLNVLILGAGGTGRKRLLGALARNIDVRERIATVEASGAIQLDQLRVQRLKAEVNDKAEGALRRSNMPELLWRALAARPGYLLVGDFPDSLQSRRVDGLLQAPGQGQTGVLAVADESDEAALLERLGSLMAVESLAEGFDVLVHLERQAGDTARVSRIAEVVTRPGEKAELVDLFTRVSLTGEGDRKVGFEATGARMRFSERSSQNGTDLEIRRTLEPAERPWEAP